MVAWEARPDILPDGIAASAPASAIRRWSPTSATSRPSAPIAAEVPVATDGPYAAPTTPEAYERWLDQASPGASRPSSTTGWSSVLRRALAARRPGRARAWQEGIDRAARDAGHDAAVVHGVAGRLRPDRHAPPGHLDPHQRRPRLHRQRRPALGVVLHHQRAGPRARADAVQGRVPRRPRRWRATTASRRRCCRRCRPGRSALGDRVGRVGPDAGPAHVPRRRAPDQARRAHRRHRRVDGRLAPPSSSELLVAECFSDHPAGRWAYVVGLHANPSDDAGHRRHRLRRARRERAGRRRRGVGLAGAAPRRGCLRDATWPVDAPEGGVDLPRAGSGAARRAWR